MPELAIAVEVLHFGIDDIRGIDRLARFEGLVEYPPCLLTNSFSMIAQGSPSIMIFNPPRNSLVL
jgi:hypothetical protein